MKVDAQETIPAALTPSLERGSNEALAFESIHTADCRFQFLNTGAAALAAVEALIANARRSICLEMYIYKSDGTGKRIRDALLAALRRGVRIRLLLDDFGSAELPKDFFAELTSDGAELRFFNPSRVLRMAFRNHRKLIIADDCEAVVGGFNIGDEYAGDGITQGWRDLGIQLSGAVVEQLILSFARLFVAARMDYSAFALFSKRSRPEIPNLDKPALLTSGPGFGGALLRRSLYRDLSKATFVDIIAAYFAPTLMLRRRLSKAAAGGRVRLVLPQQSDVPVLRLAGQHLYSRLLRDGVQIYEYMPQVLHAKLLVIDDVLYVGSCNLDVRSLRLNFELLLRIPDARLAYQARQLLAEDISRSNPVLPADWERASHWWQRMERRIAYWLVMRLDPFLARRRLRIAR